MLATPQNYTEANQKRASTDDGFVSPEQVKRMKTLPGIRSFSVVARYKGLFDIILTATTQTVKMST